ncbi:RNA polymerase sigma factor [Aeromicrobium piscarium]|uniref:Sigma-70 family RNA polymerase sigma factor n=1 Tax=Aeromicrobium piscarium TaxID=2590901 RepID=A0A554RVC4_9ACTN|nr:sigma-70 family RNA polymerase sigma factor [Aeromicrobium piscarium]TSD57985.1 sigma-70 family RNA polymerase sigma factor [Aeromicrobium piscarium]
MTGPSIEDLLRQEVPQVLGALVRRFGRFDIAEEATQEALIAASRQWREGAVPEHPRAWLIRVAYRRMIDMLRSESADRRREEQYVIAETMSPPIQIPGYDDSLHLLLLCCHPALTFGSRIALTLRAVGGLTTAEVAHAYGVTEQTMAVRISRAKQQLRTNGVRFETTVDDDVEQRITAVMRVLYLIFNEGYTVTAGPGLTRTDLTAEAIRLTRLLCALLPDHPEPTALLALMLLTDARRPARTTVDGHLIPLPEQDRGRWDRAMLAEGTERARAAWTPRSVGSFQLQAAIAAVHASAPTAEDTDWPQIAALYLALEQAEPTGPVMLSRVVAVAQAFGVEPARELFDRLDREHDLLGHPLTRQRAHAIRAHLDDAAGQTSEARSDFLAAAEMTQNESEARYLSGLAGRSLCSGLGPGADRLP